MTKMRRAILSTVAVAGVITLAAMAPKVVRLVDMAQRRYDEKLRSAVQRLKEKGLLVSGPNGIQLTQKGQRHLKLAQLPLPRPARWDRKWRILIFDIPERRKTSRNALRSMLQEAGFLRLQNSVWIYPFDCEDIITLLKIDYQLGKEVLYIIADKVENDGPIKRHFRLTQ